MQIVLVRVGIDTGSGGIHGPLFPNGSFEFIPIPDRYHGTGIDRRRYGNFRGRRRQFLLHYFPRSKKAKMATQAIHVDPEFDTFTYGDPNKLKSRLRKLKPGDIVVFYAGLSGWGFAQKPALYIVSIFNVEKAGIASSFTRKELKRHFSENFHVRHRRVYEDQKDRLVLVKGHPRKSRLLKRARLLSARRKDRRGRLYYVISREMRRIFGNFNGRVGIQRSSPRWVDARFTERAARFLRRLR